MKIGIDARPLKYKEYSGIPYMIYEIIMQWVIEFPHNDYYLISNSDIEIPKPLPQNWHMLIDPALFGNGALWQMYKLPKIIKELELDAYWGDNYLLPKKVEGCNYVLTICDLAFLHDSKVSSLKTYVVLKMFSKLSSKRADIIHAISKATKRDVIHFYGIPSENIKTIYLGLPNISEEESGDVSLPGKKYFLFLGTIEPRKNPIAILKAYEMFCDKRSDIDLVFAGKIGWRTERFIELLNCHPYKDQIHLTGYISEAYKKSLLKNAVALLYPSLYEGFGLPILEAMSLNCPVITCNRSAMPEVGGDAALYIDEKKDDTEGLFLMMENIVNIKDADMRDIKNRMKNNLKRFSWNITANELMKLLRKDCCN